MEKKEALIETIFDIDIQIANKQKNNKRKFTSINSFISYISTEKHRMITIDESYIENCCILIYLRYKLHPDNKDEIFPKDFIEKECLSDIEKAKNSFDIKKAKKCVYDEISKINNVYDEKFKINPLNEYKIEFEKIYRKKMRYSFVCCCGFARPRKAFLWLFDFSKIVK